MLNSRGQSPQRTTPARRSIWRSLLVEFAAVFVASLAFSFLLAWITAQDWVFTPLVLRGWIEVAEQREQRATSEVTLAWPMQPADAADEWPAPSDSQEFACSIAGFIFVRGTSTSVIERQTVTHAMFIKRHGWPIPVLAYVVRLSPSATTAEWQLLWGDLLRVSLAAAMSVSAATALVRWSIKRRRRARHCCASCGYPRTPQTSDSCSECGNVESASHARLRMILADCTKAS